jgi:hypothetical protein
MGKFFPLTSLKGVSSLILFPLFATGVVDTSGKFAAPGANLPPVKHHQWYRWQNLPLVSLIPVKLTPAANVPLVSLLPVVHLDLRIYPQIL